VHPQFLWVLHLAASGQTFSLLYTRTESGYSDHNFADKERTEMYVCMYVMRPQASTEAL